MHEARIRQALKYLESDTAEDSVKEVICALLIATGYDVTHDNIQAVKESLVEHIALFAPSLDSLDLR